MENLMRQFVKAIASEVANELQSRKAFTAEVKNSNPLVVRLNTKEASNHYGVDARTIRRWIDRGIIDGEKVGNRYFAFVEQKKLGSNGEN